MHRHACRHMYNRVCKHIVQRYGHEHDYINSTYVWRRAFRRRAHSDHCASTSLHRRICQRRIERLRSMCRRISIAALTTLDSHSAPPDRLCRTARRHSRSKRRLAFEVGTLSAHSLGSRSTHASIFDGEYKCSSSFARNRTLYAVLARRAAPKTRSTPLTR